MIHTDVPIKLLRSTSPLCISLPFGLVLPFMYHVVVNLFVSVMVLLRLDNVTIGINWIATYVMHQHIQATKYIHNASLLDPEASDLLNICHACIKCPPNEGDCSGMELSGKYFVTVQNSGARHSFCNISFSYFLYVALWNILGTVLAYYRKLAR